MNDTQHETRALLEGTEEALVLGYHLDESAAEFELVCESWGKCAGAARAFLLFRFFGVQQFKRKLGLSRGLRNVGTTYVARAVTGAWVIQRVDLAKVSALSVISISLGHSFGGIEFRFGNVIHDVVHLYAKPKGSNDWAYFEVGTDRPVDFFNPFGLS